MNFPTPKPPITNNDPLGIVRAQASTTWDKSILNTEKRPLANKFDFKFTFTLPVVAAAAFLIMYLYTGFNDTAMPIIEGILALVTMAAGGAIIDLVRNRGRKKKIQQAQKCD